MNSVYLQSCGMCQLLENDGREGLHSNVVFQLASAVMGFSRGNDFLACYSLWSDVSARLFAAWINDNNQSLSVFFALVNHGIAGWIAQHLPRAVIAQCRQLAAQFNQCACEIEQRVLVILLSLNGDGAALVVDGRVGLGGGELESVAGDDAGDGAAQLAGLDQMRR